ncbi:MAG: leucine-rich repeat domain-containing protein [Alphaproteobacteria bacterium]|nr:leucine-rich repeat domain-containing protein [Alphaproteobacteria bacterium]
MKKLILICCIAFLLSFGVNAQEATPRTSGDDCGDDNNCSWKIENGVLTITGYGAMKNFGHDEGNQPWLENRSSITKVVVENLSEEQGFTSIGTGAFERTATQEIILPDSITSIGDFACYDCTALEKINLPDGLEVIGFWAFGQAPLSQIDIPDTVQHIYPWAFQYTDLTDVVIPENTILDENAFFNDNYAVNSASTPLTNIYCAASNIEQCRAAVAYRGDNVEVKEYQKYGSEYYCDGRFYKNPNDILVPDNHIQKRIYTIDEANKVAGKTNRISIKYR